MSWRVRYQIFRKTDGAPSTFDTFTIEIRPDETVLDGIERIWAFQDRTLVFRHACHHASCGSCGVRVNGVETLPCVTAIQDVTADDGRVVVEPMRNFPLIRDLAVDVSPMFSRLREVGMPIVRGVEATDRQAMHRFENCIECGLCLSACPVAATSSQYLGPAILAAAERVVQEPRGASVPLILELVGGEHGAWQCRSTFECSAVCPSDVDPAEAIMALRARLIRERLRDLFRRGPARLQEEPHAR